MTTAETHKPSRLCHRRGCNAPECARADYLYRKQLELEHARGQRRLHDATQVTVHMQRLRFAGWTNAQIAAASGFGTRSVQKIINGRQRKVSAANAAALLATEIGPPPPDRNHVDPTGSVRRLQALAWLGHSQTYLGQQMGMTRDRLTDITSGYSRRVRAQEAEAIARVYRRLSVVPGRSRQAAVAAQTKGWHGPLAWDEIDNPDCQPEHARRSGANPNARKKVHADPALVLSLTRAGKSAAEIAEELGCHKRTVTRIRNPRQKQVAA